MPTVSSVDLTVLDVRHLVPGELRRDQRANDAVLIRLGGRMLVLCPTAHSLRSRKIRASTRWSSSLAASSPRRFGRERKPRARSGARTGPGRRTTGRAPASPRGPGARFTTQRLSTRDRARGPPSRWSEARRRHASPTDSGTADHPSRGPSARAAPGSGSAREEHASTRSSSCPRCLRRSRSGRSRRT